MENQFQDEKNLRTKLKIRTLSGLATVAAVLGSVAPVFAANDDAVLSSVDYSADITSALNTSVNGAVASCIALMVGLIPVCLQIMSAWVLFKFGKRFFAGLTK